MDKRCVFAIRQTYRTKHILKSSYLNRCGLFLWVIIMAIQKVDVTVPGGDTPRSANIKINANFSDQTHAASKLVGATAGLVPLAEQSAYASFNFYNSGGLLRDTDPDVFKSLSPGIYYMGGFTDVSKMPYTFNNILAFNGYNNTRLQVYYGYSDTQNSLYYRIKPMTGDFPDTSFMIYSTANVTKDANGFLKGASPVIDMYDNKIELNHDAQRQGGITFEKLGVGDYLVKGSLGFAQEGWYIEMPKDANGNVLVAVVYEQLPNNDLSIKTYAKRFDDETGDIVANLAKPRDITNGRFISLRLHEIPKEPPVMPTQNTSADAPAQTNNP